MTWLLRNSVQTLTGCTGCFGSTLPVNIHTSQYLLQVPIQIGTWIQFSSIWIKCLFRQQPEKLRVDEQTIQFHGASKLKSCIKYKKTGNRFQCDSICSNGYTAIFFFCHQPAPYKFVERGYSPLYYRILFMFEQLKIRIIWLTSIIVTYLLHLQDIWFI